MSLQSAARAFSRPVAPSTMTSSGVFRPRLTRLSRSARQAASLSPPMFLTANRTFCPSCRTPSATRSEIDVAFLSSRTRTTVPSRMSLMIGSSFKERAFQLSQSPFTLRQTRLTVSFPTAPPNKAASPAHPARVGPGKIGAGDQRVGLFCAALISRNGRVFPLDRLALRCFQTGSRDADRRWPEGSHQLALARAVPVASPHKRPAAYARFGKPRPFIPVPPKRSVEFRFQEFLDEGANAGPHPGFQRIEPIATKKKRSFGRFSRRFYGMRFHGVISIGASTPIRFEQTNWR